MEIYFDWELDDNMQKPLHKWVYEDLRSMIKSRYGLLDEEVEKRKELQVAFVVFIWKDTGDIETRYIGIPIDLVEKLKDVLKQEDMDFFMEQIGQKIDNKSNDN